MRVALTEAPNELLAAWRRLRRHSVFVAVAVATLAVGLGSSLFLFALYDQVVLRELPVERPRELVLVPLMSVSPDGGAQPFGRYELLDFDPLRDGGRDAVTLAAFARGESVVRFDGSGAATTTAVEWVSANYFEVLGLRAAAGRLFATGDDVRAGGASAVVLGHGAWQRRFARDPTVLGRAVLVDGRPHTIVGVAPPRFRSIQIGSAPELFALASAAPAGTGFELVGRLLPGVAMAQAEARLRAVRAAVLAERPPAQRFMIVGGKTTRAEERLDVVAGARGESRLRGSFSRSVLLVGVMLSVVLAVLCVNLANLLGARAADERRQMAIRLALGASRTRLALGWFGESLGIALAGGGAALVAVSTFGPRLLGGIPVPALAPAIDLRLDGRLVLAALGLSLATALFVGALAAREWSRGGLLEALGSDSSRATSDRDRARWRWLLVAVQAGLCVVLLAGTGLLVRSLERLLAIETGLPLDRVLTFRIDLSADRAGSSQARLADLVDALAELPGIDRVAYSEEPVLEGSAYYGLVSIEGYEPAADETLMVNVLGASPGLFETLGLPILRGRSIDDADLARNRRVAVVSQKFVDRYFAGRDPLGHRLSFEFARGSFAVPNANDIEIVGVVADGRLGHLRETAQPRVFPLADREQKAFTFLARTQPSAGPIAAAIERAVRERSPEAALTGLATLADRRDALLSSERFLSRLARAFGALTTLLAALGLYGVLAYTTSRRRREIALRMALGARPRQVVRTVLREGALAMALGSVAGLLAALPSARLISGFLYGVEPADPVAFGGALLVLAAAGLLACWLPARRATQVDPMAVLRDE